MFHVKHSAETQARLAAFEALVARWNPKINLVSPASLTEIRRRHTDDSAQLFEFAAPQQGHWVDLGSGGGFPALIVAILAQEQAPQLRLTCIESDRRKAAFLAIAARELRPPVNVLARRIEDAPPQAADFVSARALAPLGRLIPLALRHLAPDGIALFPKGARHAIEVAEARRHWRFALEEAPSRTEDGARLLKLRNIERV